METEPMNELDFIAKIARALNDEAPEDALRWTFKDLEAGRSENPEGWAQFRRFMDEVRSSSAIPMILEKDGEPIQALELSPSQVVASIANIEPGKYTLKLSTGRVLWEEELTLLDLVWEEAFPGEALPFAADSEERVLSFSRREELLSGELVLSVSPGLASGSIWITLGESDERAER